MRRARAPEARPAGRPAQALDAALRGGVQAGGISELVGPAGVGKTQLCLMLTAFATLPRRLGWLEGTVLYFDTENKFSSERCA